MSRIPLLSSSLRRIGAFALALMLQLSPFGMLSMVAVANGGVPTTKIVEWNFPNPDNGEPDAVADGGIAGNLTKTISTVGANTPTFGNNGYDTKSATADGWDGGDGTKYWQIEFTTTGYADLFLLCFLIG